MSNSQSLLLALLVLGLLYTGRHAIPVLLALFIPNSVRAYFAEQTEMQQLLSRTSSLPQYLNQLEQLGFVLMGLKLEKAPLWDGTYREMALVSPDAETYASVLLNKNGEPALLYFYTPFKKGGLVYTRNTQRGRELETERISARNVMAEDFSKVLADHLKRLSRMKSHGLESLIGRRQQDRIDATELYYRSSYGKHAVLAHNKLQLALFPVFIVLVLGIVF